MPQVLLSTRRMFLVLVFIHSHLCLPKSLRLRPVLPRKNKENLCSYASFTQSFSICHCGGLSAVDLPTSPSDHRLMRSRIQRGTSSPCFRITKASQAANQPCKYVRCKQSPHSTGTSKVSARIYKLQLESMNLWLTLLLTQEKSIYEYLLPSPTKDLTKIDHKPMNLLKTPPPSSLQAVFFRFFEQLTPFFCWKNC